MACGQVSLGCCNTGANFPNSATRNSKYAAATAQSGAYLLILVTSEVSRLSGPTKCSKAMAKGANISAGSLQRTASANDTAVGRCNFQEPLSSCVNNQNVSNTKNVTSSSGTAAIQSTTSVCTGWIAKSAAASQATRRSRNSWRPATKTNTTTAAFNVTLNRWKPKGRSLKICQSAR